MNQVIVDSCVWSLFFRKKQKTEEDLKIEAKLQELFLNDQLIIFGSIKQEVLSGVSE